MGFAEDVTRFADVKVIRLVDEVYVGVGDELFRSIVDGSVITGAPGQPVAASGDENAGKLRDSWQKTEVAPGETVIATDVEYAPSVEDNVRGAHFHNHGPHSVKLTIAGFPQVVAAVVQKVSGS